MGGYDATGGKTMQDGNAGCEAVSELSAGLYCDGCKWLWPSEAEQNEMKEYIDHACRKYGARVYHYGQHPRLPRLEYCKQP